MDTGQWVQSIPGLPQKPPPKYNHLFGSGHKMGTSAENLTSLPKHDWGAGRHRHGRKDDHRMWPSNRRASDDSELGARPREYHRRDSTPPPRHVRYRGREETREKQRPRDHKGGLANENPPRFDGAQAENSRSNGEDEVDADVQYDFDVAQIVPKERNGAAEDFEGLVKLLRLFIFALLFLLVLVCVTVSVAAFLVLEASLNGEHTLRWNSQSQLLYIIYLPQFFGFVQCCAKCILGEYPWPSKWILFLVVFLEMLHAFGLALLVFCVLPYFPSFYGVGLINSICIIPGLCKIFFTSSQPGHRLKSCLTKVSDTLATCVQFSALVGPLLVPIKDFVDLREKVNPDIYWMLPVSLVLVSIKWWENFVNSNTCGLPLVKMKKILHLTRTSCSIFTSLANIVVITGSVYLFEWQFAAKRNYAHYFDPPIPKYGERSYESYNETYENETDYSYETQTCKGDCADDYINSFVPGILCFLGAFFAYYISGLACKLQMQRFSFALPLLFSSPVMMALIALQCYDVAPHLRAGRLEFGYTCHGSLIVNLVHPFLCWLSMVWLTRHIWCPETERLANRDRIFVTKMYTGPLILQSLMMNRRHDQQDNRSGFMTNSFTDASTIAPTEGVKTTISRQMSSSIHTWETKRNNRVPPKIYACGTMWHETKNEMCQLLKSVMRMDIDQNSRKLAEEYFKVIDPDYYEFETHIFFDDCMDLDEDDKWIPNQFVIQFIDCLDESASSVHKEARKVAPPARAVTPYGGKLTWKLPCGNVLIAHLKDKHKIRHRKRWSQVMYMYYLLGYRIFVEPTDEVEKMLAENNGNGEKEGATKSPTMKRKNKENKPSHYGRSDIFNDMTEQTLYQLENTFVLALDGDVDFKPDAVQMLVDRMKVNPHTGAACGRIHPIGTGPLVWYQVFEYAVGHWFQKATEHILGCVLCSPGCFSLFRGSALMDDNVMKRYTVEPTEPSHFVQYDQGEDRWLCTLLLQQGYRVDYCAAADALTYAPEEFNEFFNQRRRWTPSTIANIIDLLSDAKNTVQLNPNVSSFYILYQFLLVVAMVLGPATIVLAIATAFQSVFSISTWQAYALSVAPVVFYLIICFKCKTITQLTVASYLSAFYACVMIVVLVGIIQTIVSQSILNPSLLFLAIVSASFVLAGFIHPYEFSCLMHGFLYYLCIPAGYLLLIIYSISNLHVVSWGTREVKKRKSKAQQEREKALQEKQKKEQVVKKKGGIFSYLRLDSFLRDLKESITHTFSTKKENSQNSTDNLLRLLLKEFRKMRLGRDYIESDFETDSHASKANENDSPDGSEEKPPENIADDEEIEIPPDDVKNPNFIHYSGLKDGPMEKLSEKEFKFFEDLIKKYLKPIKKDKDKEKKLSEGLLELRTKASFGFWFANLLWMLFNFMLNYDEDLREIKIFGFKTQPLGFIFIIFFMAVLLLQLVGMVMHRWVTFLQLMSITEVASPLHENISVKEAIQVVKDVQRPQTIFDEQNLDGEDISGDGNSVILVNNVRSNLRRPGKYGRSNDVAVDIERDRRNRRDEPIDKAIYRRRQEQREHKRQRPRYKDTVRSHIKDRYERLGHRGDYGGNGRTPRPTDRYSSSHAHYEDVDMRARRRLAGLSRHQERYRRY